MQVQQFRKQQALYGDSNNCKGAIRRPVSLAGIKYDSVSQVYAHGVHDILIRSGSAVQETARMQSALTSMTGLLNRTE
jgi:hypothetical protein